MKTITITEGLSQLKLLDKRITKEISSLSVVGVKEGSKVMNGFTPEGAKSEFQSVNALIERRAKLKMAINESNVKTIVSVSGVSMSVLSAIEHKKTLEYKRDLLKRLQKTHKYATEVVEENNHDVKLRLDAQVRSAFESASKKDIEDFSKTFMKNNQYDVIDALNVLDVMKKLDEEIDNFENEVDFVLSTSNATTTIEI